MCSGGIIGMGESDDDVVDLAYCDAATAGGIGADQLPPSDRGYSTGARAAADA